jgi:hypothetical protein
MRNLILKTNCRGKGLPVTTIGLPRDIPGNYEHAALQIRRLINIPDDISDNTAIKLFERTVDITWVGGKSGRLEFDFAELGEGKIIK